jgi:hypothetical protein
MFCIRWRIKKKNEESEKFICKAVWNDPKMTEIFYKLVVEEINVGNRPRYIE